ncbi:hypothetical protein D3C87_1138790 [compost metagenome]
MNSLSQYWLGEGFNVLQIAKHPIDCTLCHPARLCGDFRGQVLGRGRRFVPFGNNFWGGAQISHPLKRGIDNPVGNGTFYKIKVNTIFALRIRNARNTFSF